MAFDIDIKSCGWLERKYNAGQREVGNEVLGSCNYGFMPVKYAQQGMRTRISCLCFSNITGTSYASTQLLELYCSFLEVLLEL